MAPVINVCMYAKFQLIDKTVSSKHVKWCQETGNSKVILKL